MSTLRLYTFVNFYLSSIQQGIQSLHVCHEMFMKYRKPDNTPNAQAAEVLYDWAENHKTAIVLNGGINTSLQDLYSFLLFKGEDFKNALPWGSFNEDYQSLGGIMTAVGIVLPEEIYDAQDYKRALALGWITPYVSDTTTCVNTDVENSYFHFKEDILTIHYANSVESEFIKILKSCPLAR